jgi:methionyl-tRNA formyltransferase
MDGADSVGVSVFKLAAKMDSGPILLSVDVPVSPDDDFGSLRTKTAEAGVAAFVKFASERPADTWAFSPQDESLATFAPKISAAEERIDWTRGAPAISRQIRALSPKPGAWTTLRGKRVLILSAREAADLSAGGQPGELLHSGKFLAVQAGEGAIELTSVQTEGKKPQPASAWRNGLRISPGECFV